MTNDEAAIILKDLLELCPCFAGAKTHKRGPYLDPYRPGIMSETYVTGPSQEITFLYSVRSMASTHNECGNRGVQHWFREHRLRNQKMLRDFLAL